MSEDPPFDRTPPAATGQAELLAPGVRRLVAPNPGPFTFTGTCSYIVGRGRVAVIDPGPADERHLAALQTALAGETVEAILVTHTHRDHSSLAPALQRVTDAPTYGQGPHRSARPLALGEVNALDAGADHDFRPDIALADGQAVEGTGWRLAVVATPGHCANHLAFALGGDDLLFSGDHVMAWSTPVVAPPDGSMGDYMASLQKLSKRKEPVYFPGHGPAVNNAPRFVAAYILHRKAREQAILNRLQGGESDIPSLVTGIYANLDPRLLKAAGMSVLAHLEDMVARGQVATNGPPSIAGRYRLA